MIVGVLVVDEMLWGSRIADYENLFIGIGHLPVHITRRATRTS